MTGKEEGCSLGVENRTRLNGINGDIEEIKASILRLETKIDTVKACTNALQVEVSKPKGPTWAVTVIISLLSSGFLSLLVFILNVGKGGGS
jgi:hypothetical protein